ncbi:cyclin-dependent kinase 4 inhibitor C isoform X1 [Sebastes fasciatus]|uniref:cyclin-dependent kinase 4 inhibitor C isoform X1 n=2 Tax=Sebastes fasciatus TaxID=394691 RepID=UPI003D9F3B15
MRQLYLIRLSFWMTLFVYTASQKLWHLSAYIFFTRMADSLCNAAASGDLSKVLFLLQSGAGDVNGLNFASRTAMQVVKWGNSAVIESLLLAGANPNLPDRCLSLTASHDGAREGYIDSMRVLVEHGADVNLLDARGELPLHHAAREGHLEVIELLIGLTENPQTPNQHGHTAEQLAHLHKKEHAAKSIHDYLSPH